jgi:hypothetical protein
VSVTGWDSPSSQKLGQNFFLFALLAQIGGEKEILRPPAIQTLFRLCNVHQKRPVILSLIKLEPMNVVLIFYELIALLDLNIHKNLFRSFT